MNLLPIPPMRAFRRRGVVSGGPAARLAGLLNHILKWKMLYSKTLLPVYVMSLARVTDDAGRPGILRWGRKT